MIAQLNILTGDELSKLFRGGKLKALLLLSFLIGILFVFIGDRVGLSGNLPVIALELLLPFVFPLFMVSLGSDLMVSEFKDGTIKNALKLPLSREIIFVGKMLAGWTAGALIVLTVFVPMFVGSIFLMGMPTPSAFGASMAEVGGAITSVYNIPKVMFNLRFNVGFNDRDRNIIAAGIANSMEANINDP